MDGNLFVAGRRLRISWVGWVAAADVILHFRIYYYKAYVSSLHYFTLHQPLTMHSRIVESIQIAKQQGAKYRLGPELEISGYSCEDHFLELDLYLHCDQSLAAILSSDLTDGILCDVGCPVLHRGVRYNCRVFCLNRKVVLVRPKIYLADDGNYREKRFFSSWDAEKVGKCLEKHVLSDLLQRVTGQREVPMGVGIIATNETSLAAEMCEELWTSNAPHIRLFLSGVEIISNGSGSHHELRKLDSRLSLIKSATSKSGGVYMYANQRGCDGNRLYFDGSSSVCVNGNIVGQATQFSLKEVEVIVAVVDLDAVRTYRGRTNSLMEQSSTVHHKESLASQTVDIAPFSLRRSDRADDDIYSMLSATAASQTAFASTQVNWSYLLFTVLIH
jgi:NAD+ synthase (glutamine-hydrolysing)